MLGSYAFVLYAFGPALALLRPELRLSYAVIGLNSSLWSAGAAVAGLTFPWMSRRAGRYRVFWGAALVTALGAAVLGLATAAALTLAAAAVLGTAGTMIEMGTSSVLSDRHLERRDRALVEANIGAGICAVAAPALLGALQQTPLTWRAAMVLPVAGLGACYLAFRRVPLPAAPPAPAGSALHGRLPRAYWLLAMLVAVTIAVEFCVIYFGAELLTATTGLSTTAAATALGLFYGGILAGRIAGARITRRPGRGTWLVVASLAVTLAGFAAFWLSGVVVVALAGLLVTGLGVANLFPLTLALALATVPHRADAANAGVHLLGGLIVLAGPLLLGTIADHLGLRAAFSIEPLLLLAAAGLLWAGLAQKA